MNKKLHRIAHAAAAGLIVFSLLLLGIAIARACEHKADEPLTTAVYIVYDDEDGDLQASHLYSRPTEPAVPLNDGWYQTVAEMVAGKAGDRMYTCQAQVANAIYNDLVEQDWDMQAAIDEYDLFQRATPTEQTYAAVDQIFMRNEYMLDPEVLWFNDTAHPSAFHDGLVFVTECDGIAFYKAHRPNMVPEEH